MKKLIAILVVFAVLAGTALFAQDEGSWSVSGSGEIGTLLNFVPYELRDEENIDSVQSVLTIGGMAYNRYDWYGDVAGKFNVGYKKGGLSAGLSFNQNARLGANVNYDANGLRFQAESDVMDLLNGNYFNNVLTGYGLGLDWERDDDGAVIEDDDGYATLVLTGTNNRIGAGGYRLGRLWGWYKFLNGMIHVEAAVDSRDTQFWNSSGLIDDTYTKVDHHNYLVLDFAPIQGLNAGLMLPGIFTMFTDTNGNRRSDRPLSNGKAKTGLDSDDVYYGSLNAYPDSLDGFGAYREFVKESLEQMTFGVKYATGPFGAALQYGLRGRPVIYDDGGSLVDTTILDSVLYAGGTFNINSQMYAEAAFHSNFKKSSDDVNRIDLRLGGRFGYNAGPLGARLDVIYFNDVRSNIENGYVRFRPYLTYDIIPQQLRFRLDTRFDLPLSKWALSTNEDGVQYTAPSADVRNAEAEDLTRRASRTWDFGYRVIPELFFNFYGNGLGDYWSIGTGIIVRYRLEGFVYGSDAMLNRYQSNPTINALDVTFKWSF